MVDPKRVERAHERLEEHDEALDHHDRRISRNENYRLQAQGALKVLALIVGSGAVAAVAEVIGII